MYNIIIYQHNVLIETVNNKVRLPETKNIELITSILQPIYITDEYYVATIENSQAEIFKSQHAFLYFINLRQAMNHLPDSLVKKIVYFQQLNEYYLTHKFCGRCGNPTIKRELNKFVYCPNCNQENYPHIAPCVIVRVHHENKILMARGINFPPGAWGLIAGFVEIGESLEEAIVREVYEEVGIEIENISYWGSEPWPFPSNSLMVGYTATYKSGQLILDSSEIEAAGFYPADALPGKPSTSYSIASRMIENFIELNKTPH